LENIKVLVVACKFQNGIKKYPNFDTLPNLINSPETSPPPPLLMLCSIFDTPFVSIVSKYYPNRFKAKREIAIDVGVPILFFPFYICIADQ